MAVLTKITSRSLADNAVTSAHVQADTLAAADIADGSISTAKLADDAVTTAKILDDNVTAAKIPAGAVVADVGAGGIGATQLATNAVTTIKIANDAVDADKLASNAVVTASIVDANITAAKIGTAAVTSAKMGDVIEVKPHIKYGMLYPSLKDVGGTRRLSDGVTALAASTVGPAGSAIASSLYGTVQADGKMYYYTDIKGSKPIKDPRIGSHFGSQRHKLKSIQLLKQETATNGTNVYSMDGREWCRGVHNWNETNSARGSHVRLGYPEGSASTGTYMEVTGYFNAVNLLNFNEGARAGLDYYIDGGSATQSNDTQYTGTSPLDGRFVDAQALHSINVGTITTPGIHTLKILIAVPGSWGSTQTSGIELIAQDTTDATTRNQIQIHPQNVVSYGKRFAIDDTVLHYNPFAFKTDGTTAWASGAHNGTGWPAGANSAHNIDTATSLGLDKWLHSSNYYKPYNGGRVVIWVDSSGAIKTSVTAMPPNARSVNTGALAAKANASIANNTYLPTFEAGAADDFPTIALSEIAKTYNWREFGNGAANGGTLGSMADATMVDTYDNIAYIMDDGLTSLAANDVNNSGGLGCHLQGDDDDMYISFIGTGISIKVAAGTHGGTDNWKWYIDGVEVRAFTSGFVHSNDFRIAAQNLPYGTHIFHIKRVTANSFGMKLQEVTFYQPKIPLISENACIIADYMLMADFVPQTAADQQFISKGVRTVSGSRDGYYAGNHAINHDITNYMAPTVYQSHSTSNLNRLPAFGSNIVKRTYRATTRYQAFYINDTGHSSAVATTKVGTGHGSAYHPTSDVALGNNIFETFGGIIGAAGNDTVYGQAWEIASPIHTSSHYQTFETPYLHELIGGDRNMEQTNLVVTPDGKTWDEVTRDTSYLSPNMCVSGISRDAGTVTAAAVVVFDEHRGWQPQERRVDCYFKDFVYAYDRFICLVDGQYEFFYHTYTGSSFTDTYIMINGNVASRSYGTSTNINLSQRCMSKLKRGDYVQVKAGWFGNNDDAHSGFFITRLGER